MTGCKLYLYIIGAAGEREKLCGTVRYASSKLLTNVTAYTGFSARGRVLFNGCHYIGAAITPDCTLQRLGQLYDHTFCPSMISSGAFMRNWAMCKKVLAESHFFLKHGWIHFLGFLLIPRYNHDRIIREFRRPRRRTGILCFVMEGYALIAVRR